MVWDSAEITPGSGILVAGMGDGTPGNEFKQAVVLSIDDAEVNSGNPFPIQIVGGGAYPTSSTMYDNSGDSYPLAVDISAITTATAVILVPNAPIGTETLALTLPDPEASGQLNISVVSDGANTPTVTIVGGIVNDPHGLSRQSSVFISAIPAAIPAVTWVGTITPGGNNLPIGFKTSGLNVGVMPLAATAGSYAGFVVAATLDDDIDEWGAPEAIWPGVITHIYTQDGVGNRIISPGASTAGSAQIQWVGGVPTLSVAAGESDVIRFTQLSSDGVNWLGEVVEQGITI